MKSRQLLGVLNPNALIGRTVWSSPQGGCQCSLCFHYASHNTNVSELTVVVQKDEEGRKKFYRGPREFGACQNVRVWAAYGKDNPPTTRSYHYCNFYEEKEKEDGKQKGAT